MSSIFPSSAPLGGGGGLFGGGGNALGGGLAPLGGAGAARDPKLGAPSPASLENYKLYIKILQATDREAEVSDVQNLATCVTQLEAQLRAANPINVQPKHPATRLQLEKWLNKESPPEQAVHWDADAPFAAGQVVGQHYDPAMVKQLSDDLELDELRCLELIAQVVLKPEVRRIIEEELDLGAGVIESIDSPYFAALELFYLERGFLMRSLKELMIQSHPNSQTLSHEAKAALRTSLTQSLLQGGALAEGLRKTLVLLTHELRKTDPKVAGNNTAALVRRREFLRSERLHAAETLFFLCHSFGVEACGPSLPELLVAATKDLALDQAFFDPSRGASAAPPQQDDFDDRPGLVRCLGLLQLALMHVLEKELPTAAASAFRAKLGLDLSGDEMVPWEGEAGSSSTGDEVRLRNFGYYKRQRASKPEVSGVQGLACLAYVAAKRPSAGASETSRHLQGWFKRSLEHFALTWLTRNIGAALKVDACNLSDFRGRPDQMEVSYLALASLRGLLHRVLTLIKNGHLPSLPTLQRYQESLYRKAELDGTNPSVDELDTFEDLTAAVSEVLNLSAADNDWQLEMDGGVGPGTSECLCGDTLLWLLRTAQAHQGAVTAPEGDHAATFGFYAHHSQLLAATASADPTTLATHVAEPPPSGGYLCFWMDRLVHKGGPVSLLSLGEYLAGLKQDATVPSEHRSLLTAPLLGAWTACLDAMRAALANPALQSLSESDPATRQQGPLDLRALVQPLLLVASSQVAWVDPQAEDKLPALFGAIFKLLGAWVAADGTRADTLMKLLVSAEMSFLPEFSKGRTASSSVHTTYMRRLESGRVPLATDGLLCLLAEVLPRASGSDRDGAGMAAWAHWAVKVMVDCGGWAYAEAPEKFKVAARALQVLTNTVAHGSTGVRRVVLEAMLAHTVLLKSVLSLIPEPQDGSVDSASALDQACALEARNSLRDRLVFVPTPVSLEDIPVDLSTTPGLTPSLEPWAWWRQRAVMLALTLLCRVAAQENAFIAEWHANRKAARGGGGGFSAPVERSNTGAPPHRLEEWLLDDQSAQYPQPVRAITHLIGYARQPLLPVLASSLLAHFARGRQSPMLARALLASDRHSVHVVSLLQGALMKGAGHRITPTQWQPSADLAGVHPHEQASVIVAAARDLRGGAPLMCGNPAENQEAFWGEVSLDLPLTALDMLLSPLLTNAPPVLTLELLGLGAASPFPFVLEALLELLCQFYESLQAGWQGDNGDGGAATLANTCAEVLCRVLVNREEVGGLETTLDKVVTFLAQTRRDPDLFYLPAPSTTATTTTSLDPNDASNLAPLEAWQLKIAALALGTACGVGSERKYTVPARVVPKLIEGVGPLLVPKLATTSGCERARGWESLLSVALCVAPQAWPALRTDPCLGAPSLARLLLATLEPLAQLGLEADVAEPLADSCEVLAFTLTAQTPDPSALSEDEASNLFQSLLNALHVRQAATFHYKSALASSLTHLARCFTRDYDTASSSSSAEAAAASRHRTRFLHFLSPHCEALPCLLASDACAEDNGVKWRVASCAALALLVELAENGSVSEAKLLQALWLDHHLERLVHLATNALAPQMLRDSASAVLTQVALRELGAGALKDLGLVSHLTKLCAEAPPDALQGGHVLQGPCQLLGTMLVSLPKHTELGEDCLRFLSSVKAPLSQVLAPSSVLGSLAGLRAAESVTSLLGAALGALDSARRDRKLLECFPDYQGTLLEPCAHVLDLLGAFPSSVARLGEKAWSSLEPQTSDEVNASRVIVPPPPGASGPWSAFDTMKAEAWWAFAASLSLTLHRMPKASSVNPAPLLACAAAIAEPLVRGGATSDENDEWGWLGTQAVEVAEMLLSLAVEQWWVSGADERSSAQESLVNLLPRLEALHGMTSVTSVYGASSESELFLKKFCQALAWEFDTNQQ